MKNSPGKSFLDGLGNALGYGVGLVSVAFFRELLGSGSIYGITVMPTWLYEAGYRDATIFVLAPGAFFVLGLLIWLLNSIQLKMGNPIESEHSGHAH